MTEHKIIAIFSLTGGSGVTVLATQLAARLSQTAKTCLVDLNLDAGNCESYLNPSPTPLAEQSNLLQVTNSIKPSDLSRLNDGTLAVSAYSVKYGQLVVIGTPSEQVHAEAYCRILLERCKRDFEITVVDLPHTLIPAHALVGLKMADIIIVREYYPSERSSNVFKANEYLESQIGSQHKRLYYALSSRPVAQNVPLWVILATLALGAGAYVLAAVADVVNSWQLKLVLVAPAIAIPILALLCAAVVPIRLLWNRNKLMKEFNAKSFDIAYDRMTVSWIINQGDVADRKSPFGKSITRIVEAL
ncbi:MAG: hypothetical protein K2W95_31315 [Candidatus Obscuribacterales bacterium]|nr:hypothetical protein [Candidatus Obscuribacterales bacterium]